MDLQSAVVESSVKVPLEGTVLSAAAGSSFVCFVVGDVLCVTAGCTTDGFAAQVTQVTLPFPPLTLCAAEELIFTACSEAMLLLEVQHGKASILRSSACPANCELFGLVASSIFCHGTEFIAFTSRMFVTLVGCATLEAGHIDVAGGALLAASPEVLFVVTKANDLSAWSIPNRVLIKDNGIICSNSCATSLAVDCRTESLVVGVSNGTVRILSISQRKDPPFLSTLMTISLTGDNIMSKMPLMGSECGNVLTVLSIDIFGEFLIAGTTAGMLLIGRTNYEVSVLAPFDAVSALSALSPCGNAIIYRPFEPSMLLLRLSLGRTLIAATLDAVADMVHAEKALPPALVAPLDKRPAKKDTQAKPVTFGRGPIKSTGYSSTPPWSVQQALKAKKANLKGAKKRVPSPVQIRYNTSPLPTSCELSRSSAILDASPIHASAINALAFDATGNHLVSASNDTTVHVLKLPCVKHSADGYCLKAHPLAVLAVDCSLHINNPLVVSAGLDGTWGMWSPAKPRDLPYVLNNQGKEVRCVKFYYMDCFVCVAAGSSITAFKYYLDNDSDDLNRGKNDSRVSPAFTIPTAAQSVVAFDCFNSFLSNVIVWAGSNKAVGIHDVEKNVSIRVIEGAHSRNIHSLEVMRSSRYADIPSDALHVFSTAGLDKCVRLWDMRQQQAARVLSGHSNAGMKVGLALSPCGRFVAVGSEDRAFYLYDRCGGALMERVPMADTVTALRYHPTQVILAAGTAAGQLRFFTEAQNSANSA